jgi:hypothetical protein
MVLNSNTELVEIHEEVKNRISKNDSYDEALEKVKTITKELCFYHEVEQSSSYRFQQDFDGHLMNPSKIEAHYFEQFLYGFYWETKTAKHKYRENIVAYNLFEILKQKRW